MYLFNPWWEHKEFFTGIRRERYLEQLSLNISGKQAILIVGSRRVGKTVLMHQLIRQLLDQKVKPETLIYLPLDHPSLGGKKILELVEEIRAGHGLKREEKLYLFLDEVQFSPTWEQEAKAITDFENIKLFISGSATTKIISKGAFLTGRTLTFNIEPFNFQEFVTYNGGASKSDSAFKNSLFKKYLEIGGYPEYVNSQNPLYFSDLITNVVNKDITTLFPVNNSALISQLLSLLADRAGSQSSLTKLGKILDLTKDTIKDYLYYLSSTFLVTELGKLSVSRNSTLYSPKKYYLLDTGLLFNLTGKLNLGAAAENIVFHKLLSKSQKPAFFFEDQKELDFVVGDLATEVKYELSDMGWEKLASQIKKIPADKFKKIIVLTTNVRKKEVVGGIKVDFESLVDFCLA